MKLQDRGQGCSNPHLLRGDKLLATVEKVKELLKLHKINCLCGEAYSHALWWCKAHRIFSFKVEYKSKENLGKNLSKNSAIHSQDLLHLSLPRNTGRLYFPLSFATRMDHVTSSDQQTVTRSEVGRSIEKSVWVLHTFSSPAMETPVVTYWERHGAKLTRIDL